MALRERFALPRQRCGGRLVSGRRKEARNRPVARALPLSELGRLSFGLTFAVSDGVRARLLPPDKWVGSGGDLEAARGALDAD